MWECLDARRKLDGMVLSVVDGAPFQICFFNHLSAQRIEHDFIAILKLRFQQPDQVRWQRDIANSDSG